MVETDSLLVLLINNSYDDESFSRRKELWSPDVTVSKYPISQLTVNSYSRLNFSSSLSNSKIGF